MSPALLLFPELCLPPSPRLRRRLAAPSIAPASGFGASSWRHFTPRQREVFAKPRTLATLLELLRERPRGTCTICWRDMSLALAGSTTQVACSREDGTGRTRWCQTYVVHCYRDGERRREAAKAGLVATLEGGAT
ncbi:hypothetical protein [Myxococcus virescens]|uniref:Uncharacterized protein n=1 Tax=Myxococcus virescens TaxID=83456 RepID=A0A511HNL5_9BACT|nr:hypothetical protein [Myxococcus virescens]GEL75171.1 hypothetical protein MVI01_69550 [Myxococcus virescens]SDD64423.1 hypothetical protein SAMN04488504_10296 [Myxococcus virescens]